jgi:hypothetical protein
MCFRALTTEEEGIEEKIIANWEAFLFHMQDAMEFVNTQTPLITHHLDEMHMVGFLFSFLCLHDRIVMLRERVVSFQLFRFRCQG